MRKTIQVYVSLLMIFLSFNGYSQYGVIEMKNGDQLVMKSPQLSVEKESLRYFIEDYKQKVSFMGIGYKKLKKEYLDKSRLVKISEIKKIHVEGELLVGSKSVLDFIGVRYIKIKRNYRKFFVIEDGECKLLVQPENGNALYSYYLQTGNEEPYKLHQVGTTFGAKFRKKSMKYFADCAPAMKYIKSDLKQSTFPKLIGIYNANCVK
jgi:hypothetical protein